MSPLNLKAKKKIIQVFKKKNANFKTDFLFMLLKDPV